MGKARNIFFATIIIFLLLSVPAYFLLFEDRPRFSALEYRQYANFPKPSIDTMLKGSFQGGFETALSEQFPARDYLLSINLGINRQIAKAAYSLARDRAIPISDKSDSPMLYWMKGMDILLPQPQVYDESYDKAIINQAAAFDNIIKKNVDTNFHMYLVENIYSSSAHPSSEFYPKSVRGQFASTFMGNAPKGLNVKLFRLNSFDEYEEYYFRTDHHWNSNGAWKAYNDVYSMLAKTWPGIGNKLENKGFTTYDMVEFRGAYARKAAYPYVFDIIKEPVVELPEYEVFINNVPRARNNKNIYYTGEFNKQPFYNHYSEIFGLDYGLIEYRKKVPTGRNLLIIGPSYTQTMEGLIASHYASTWVVDLRYYERDLKKSFDMTQFIKNNSIDDVLFIIEPQSFLTKEWQVR